MTDRELTRAAKREMRRETVLRLRTPLLRALLKAAVASRSAVLATAAFLDSTAANTFFMMFLTELNTARLRWARRSDCRTALIVDL